MSEFLNAATLTRLMRPGDFKNDALAQSITDEQREAVTDAMRHLKSYQHAVILMRYQRGFSVEHTARELMVSPAIVQAREAEALDVLRRNLPDSRDGIVSVPTIRYFKDETKEPTMSAHKGMPHKKRIDRAPVFAWLDAHPNATGREIRDHFHIGNNAAYYIREEWQKHAPHDVEQEVTITMPERPVVARHTPVALRQAALQPITAPATRTWYEEQIFQARTFCEVLEEQERAALAFYQQRQEETKAARRRYDEAVRIAEQFSRMTRGQIIERIGIEQ